jgi:Predicted nucleotide-binding protein containing TIR-like domain
MDKSRIFIASSGRTLVLAEKLRDELRTEFCEATLWSEEGRLRPGETIIEMLEGAAGQYDFAVIILAKDDVITGGQGEILKARDNCVFEAGLFMSAIGRKRCFLVNSVSQSDLPSDLNGIISIPFGEPANLQDRFECAQAIAKVAAHLKDIVQREGPSAYHARVPLLSVEEVFRRERPRSEGGDLEDGQVVVLDRQPWADIGRAKQVRRNMDNGTSYHYFLYFSDDTVEKICQALQIIAWAGVRSAEQASDFSARVDTIRNNRDRVLADLRNLCEGGRLRASLMVEDPIVCFRVHNASNPTLAQFYLKYHDEGFVRWAEGQDATVLWRTLPTYLEEDTGDRLFLPLKDPIFGSDQRQRTERVFSRVLGRYFPGMEIEVKQIFFGD